jgi:hypothetical protein
MKISIWQKEIQCQNNSMARNTIKNMLKEIRMKNYEHKLAAVEHFKQM